MPCETRIARPHPTQAPEVKPIEKPGEAAPDRVEVPSGPAKVPAGAAGFFTDRDIEADRAMMRAAQEFYGG